jgi:hypothetical protein
MKCPACGKRLHKIPYMDLEFVCHNTECSTMDRGSPKEFYGTQNEINELWQKQSMRSILKGD